MCEVGYVKPEDWKEVEEHVSKTIYHARHGHYRYCKSCGAELMADGTCYDCEYLCDPEHPRPCSCEVDL